MIRSRRVADVAEAPPPMLLNRQLATLLRFRAKIENALNCYDLADDDVRANCAGYARTLKHVLDGVQSLPEQ